MASTIAPELRSKLERNPNAIVNLIVRLTDDPAPHLDDVQARGLQVRHTYTLISAMAVQGKASAVLPLVSVSWVLSIEEDPSVHTM